MHDAEDDVEYGAMSEVSSEIRVGWAKQNADGCDRRTMPMVFLTSGTHAQALTTRRRVADTGGE